MQGMGSWGDCIMLIPAIQALRDKGEEVVLQMHNDEQCRQVSTIFNGLAKVEFVDNPASRLYITNTEKIHTAKRSLHELGFYDYSCIPKIELTADEINWAKDFLKDYKRSITFINNNSGDWDKTNYRAHYVRPPIKLIQYLVDYFISNGWDVLQFGRKEDERFTPLNGAKHIRGLSIRQLLSCYHVIGKMISGDTGDQHGIISVGGKSVVFHPPESDQFGYHFWDLHYTPELWKDESVRIRYQDYTKFSGNLSEILQFIE